MEPITTALAAIAAVKQITNLVKETCGTVDDISSLAPMLGKYFGKKQEVVKSYEEAKKSNFKGSSMAKSIEIELELDRMKTFESEIQMLFFQCNKMDVWQKILSRAAAMDEDFKVQQRMQKTALANKAKKEKEEIELALILLGFFTILAIVGYFTYEAYYFCETYICK